MRCGHTLVGNPNDHSLYLFGGRSGENKRFNDVYIYNIGI